MASHQRKSKKRSDTKVTPEKRLELVTFFIDRSLGGEKVPNALRNIGLKVEIHSDHFAHDAPDTEWLQRCGEESWVVLSKDWEIRRNLLEKQAIMSYGVAAFFLTKQNATAEANVEAIIKGLRKIANHIENQERPFICRILPDGKVQLVLDHKGKDYLVPKKGENKV